DAQNGVPTAELVQEVQMDIDPEQNHGKGLGLAPIGHTVTVQGAASFAVNISAAITCTQGHTWADISPSVSAAAAAYLAALAVKWPDGNLIVRVSGMESCLLNVGGVLDVENLTLNGAAANLPVPDDKVPTLGAVTNANSTA
ncbi:MAG: phage tail protein, partial [Ruminococcaceae bacterium]|nr:phage tail protein [Oscillospiraceae bacterium]